MGGIGVVFQRSVGDGEGFVASANPVCRYCSLTGFYSRMYRIGTSSSFYLPTQRSDIYSYWDRRSVTIFFAGWLILPEG